MKEALFYEKATDKQVICRLCPHHCRLKDGQAGICRVRKNEGGILFTEVYGKVAALNLDPIEKKPLYHFFPGRPILSLGTVGCNLQCRFCQNWQISQSSLEETTNCEDYSPEQVASIAMENRENLGMAYTYNEPTIFYEYMKDIATLVHRMGGMNVMVSNGFIDPEPLQELYPVMDAFSIDLKAFTESFYRTQTHSRLEPVKKCLIDIVRAGKHLEITNLVIPTLNDDPLIFEDMVHWIRDGLGEGTVLHLSRYFPQYKTTLPQTPVKKLEDFYAIAKKYLSFVYLGNISLMEEGHDTFCPSCHQKVIERMGYLTRLTGLDPSGYCMKCHERILTYILAK
jgi:pyruvate formate lyase activating enzyme